MTSGAAGNASRKDEGPAVRTERRIEAARGYLVLDMPDHALKELTDAGNTLRHRFDVARLRGDSFRLLGRFDDAVAAYTRALAERPDALPALVGVAGCYRRLGRLDRAITAMEDANRFHPNEPAVLLTLSRFYALGGDVPRALGWLGRAIRLCPDVATVVDGDADFEPLKCSPHFQMLVEAGQARQGS